MKPFLSIITLTVFFFSCSQQKNGPVVTGSKTTAKKVDKVWLDSIIKNSDSNYFKPYRRTDFVTAFFYINKKDSTICQVMKDSADDIRQIIIAKKDIRSFFAQYYANGQLQAELPLDEFGQYHGPSIYYYEDGTIQSNGNYIHGLKTGQWKNFDDKGKLLSTDSYDQNGQRIP